MALVNQLACDLDPPIDPCSSNAEPFRSDLERVAESDETPFTQPNFPKYGHIIQMKVRLVSHGNATLGEALHT